VTSELARVARAEGATLVTGAEVTEVDPDGTVRFTDAGGVHTLRGEFVRANVTPAVLD